MLGVVDERRNKKILKMIEEARKRVEKMTPAEVKAMHEAQAQSWARQDLD